MDDTYYVKTSHVLTYKFVGSTLALHTYRIYKIKIQWGDFCLNSVIVRIRRHHFLDGKEIKDQIL